MINVQWIPLAVITISLVACVVDVRTRRIPNVLTLGAAAAGFLIQILAHGLTGAQAAAGGWLVGTLLLLPFFLLRGMGAGDVKLVAGIGAWLGPGDAFWLVIFSGLAGGVLGILVAATQGYLRTAFRNLFVMFAYWRSIGLRPVPNFTLDSAKTPRLAYAIPIFAGTVMTLWA